MFDVSNVFVNINNKGLTYPTFLDLTRKTKAERNIKTRKVLRIQRFGPDTKTRRNKKEISKQDRKKETEHITVLRQIWATLFG